MKLASTLLIALFATLAPVVTAIAQTKNENIVASPSSSASDAVRKEPKKPVKPFGACTITVAGITPTCTQQTLDGCNSTAKKVGGVADWQQGKTCK